MHFDRNWLKMPFLMLAHFTQLWAIQLCKITVIEIESPQHNLQTFEFDRCTGLGPIDNNGTEALKPAINISVP